MANILGVGNATLDIIHGVVSYPEEDNEVRAASKVCCSGGNCLNTLTVLKQLGHDCTFIGTLANDMDGTCLQQEIKIQGININHCPIISGKTPTSYILLSKDTGARTIVHYRDLPELSFEDFNHIDLSQFDWLHFEGRNLPEISKMLSFTRTEFPTLPCSIEIEKPRENIESLFSQADVLFFSQHYLTYLGCAHPEDFLNTLQGKFPHRQIDKICPWGDQGTYGMFSSGELFHEPAYVPRQIIDTLGAGDTFNAGYIHACLNKYSFPKRLHFACRIAGEKCGQKGLHSLTNII
ncbi:PfkB family carbohydrate kinase [Candidatus Nitrosacidococcus tergens]|uniref:Ketohexokinase n=1 Tax=Candidatus Nitrosacidococcus tergens TaxID=553981 RepID=A0A7G1QB28_9GAMM|nr:PfkB family carbohydrate kinase [Candidatus Nitrosacidococcus tergens]CAB1276907.1 Ketohexokinase [Candidatus Nitrosacidococcus tergens]